MHSDRAASQPPPVPNHQPQQGNTQNRREERDQSAHSPGRRFGSSESNPGLLHPSICLSNTGLHQVCRPRARYISPVLSPPRVWFSIQRLKDIAIRKPCILCFRVQFCDRLAVSLEVERRAGMSVAVKPLLPKGRRTGNVLANAKRTPHEQQEIEDSGRFAPHIYTPGSASYPKASDYETSAPLWSLSLPGR